MKTLPAVFFAAPSAVPYAEAAVSLTVSAASESFSVASSAVSETFSVACLAVALMVSESNEKNVS